MAAVYFFLYAGVGVAVPFIPLWLRSLGFSYGQIGLLMAISAGTGALTQTALGSLSDRLRRRRPLLILACLGLALLYLLYPHAGSFAALAVLHAYSGFCSFSANTLASAMVIDLAPKGEVAHVFARTRSWGSLGFLITTGIVSVVPAIVDPRWLFLVACGLNLAAMACAGWSREGAIGQNTTPVRLRDGLWLLRQREVVILLLTSLVFWACLQGSTSSLSLLIESLGGSRAMVSRAFLVAVVAEIPFMWMMGRASDRFGRRPILLVAAAALPLRLLLYSQAAAPEWVLPIQAFHGLTFSVAAVVPMAFMSDIVAPRLRASGQGLLNAVYAAGSSLGPLVAGQVSDEVGLSRMYAYLAGAAAMGALLALVALPEPEGLAGRPT